jgi:hypothetical protein
MMLEAATAEYVHVILQVAERDESIARVLREICGLDSPLRSTALGLVVTHLRTHGASQDALDCIALLRQDAVAQRIVEVLSAPSSE